MLVDKYSTIIDMATSMGIQDLTINEADGVLQIEGTAPSDTDRQKLLDEYERIDPGFSSGDLVLNIGSSGGTTYTVRSGDTLSGIGQKYGVSWQDIFEANRDILDNPDVIKPGQELRIPGV